MPFRLGSICPEIYLGFCYVYLTCANIIKPYRILPIPMLAFFFLFNFNMLGLKQESACVSAAGDRMIHFPDAFIPLLSERKRDAEKCFGITFRHSLSFPLPACNCSPTPLLKELSFMSTAKGEARRTQLTHLAQDENEGEWGKCLPVCVSWMYAQWLGIFRVGRLGSGLVALTSLLHPKDHPFSSLRLTDPYGTWATTIFRSK